MGAITLAFGRCSARLFIHDRSVPSWALIHAPLGAVLEIELDADWSADRRFWYQPCGVEEPLLISCAYEAACRVISLVFMWDDKLGCADAIIDGIVVSVWAIQLSSRQAHGQSRNGFLPIVCTNVAICRSFFVLVIAKICALHTVKAFDLVSELGHLSISIPQAELHISSCFACLMLLLLVKQPKHLPVLAVCGHCSVHR
mmetsp:Transcript_109454/g.189369  ORF Transcript_109454/g.189369 Transcript_109454/m.189369 type:complete len:200 (+) Transcript_109454:179-778(+)